MKSRKLFIGNIRKCTKYIVHSNFNNTPIEQIEIEDELYKENAILMQTKNGGYIDLENLNSILDFIKIHMNTNQNKYIPGNLIMPTIALCRNNLFVDKKTLKPYSHQPSKKKNYGKVLTTRKKYK